MLASLGSVVFEVRSDLVRTFRDATHTTSARWTAHEVIAQKPKQEFGGPGLRKLSLAITLDSQHGTDPETEAATLRTSCETGEVLPLVLGEEPHGSWVLAELVETWRRVAANGSIGAIDLTLSLEEYA